MQQLRGRITTSDTFCDSVVCIYIEDGIPNKEAIVILALNTFLVNNSIF